MPSAEHKRLRAPVCDLRATGRGVSFFYLSIILRPVSAPTRRLTGVELLHPLSRSQNGQLLGLGASILRGARQWARPRAEYWRVLVDGSKGVPDVEVRDLAAEDDAGDAGEVGVQARPESGVDDLVAGVARRGEVPYRGQGPRRARRIGAGEISG